jgi:hypothetical protein
MLYYKLHQNNNQFNRATKRHNNKPSKPFGERNYLPDVSRKTVEKFVDERAGLDPKISFNQMATEIRELREGKALQPPH